MSARSLRPHFRRAKLAGFLRGNHLKLDVNDPVEADNLAHCQIECNPLIESGSRFKKLKAALANLANKHGFVVPPSDDGSHQADF